MRNTLKTTEVLRSLTDLFTEYEHLGQSALNAGNNYSYDRYMIRADAAGAALRMIYHLAGMNEYEIASTVSR